ncbi:glucosaminidase domain-containing protein [uncultured Bacteroides sp.]|uniref:glycoside hydrolase family 73 protein n=1 Tax=uncultured Bacteroides sp. TaxID=162156 RepID=UPI002AABACEC|nr:glucosaminidase domain-containing protein [uncultured Bacteroides sp.]
MTPDEFIKKIYPEAKHTDINPVFVTAQAALESAWGAAAIGGTNLFGITKGSNWNGKTQLVLTTEYFKTNQVKFALPEKAVRITPITATKYKYKVYRLFRVYPTISDCLIDHTRILQKPGYADAWPCRHDGYRFVKAISNSVGAKYATDPNYVKSMNSIMLRVERTVQKLGI